MEPKDPYQMNMFDVREIDKDKLFVAFNGFEKGKTSKGFHAKFLKTCRSQFKSIPKLAEQIGIPQEKVYPWFYGIDGISLNGVQKLQKIAKKTNKRIFSTENLQKNLKFLYPETAQIVLFMPRFNNLNISHLSKLMGDMLAFGGALQKKGILNIIRDKEESPKDYAFRKLQIAKHLTECFGTFYYTEKGFKIKKSNELVNVTEKKKGKASNIPQVALYYLIYFLAKTEMMGSDEEIDEMNISNLFKKYIPRAVFFGNKEVKRNFIRSFFNHRGAFYFVSGQTTYIKLRLYDKEYARLFAQMLKEFGLHPQLWHPKTPGTQVSVALTSVQDYSTFNAEIGVDYPKKKKALVSYLEEQSSKTFRFMRGEFPYMVLKALYAEYEKNPSTYMTTPELVEIIPDYFDFPKEISLSSLLPVLNKLKSVKLIEIKRDGLKREYWAQINKDGAEMFEHLETIKDKREKFAYLLDYLKHPKKWK